MALGPGVANNVASVVPAICVTAASVVAVAAIVGCVVHRIALRAIDKAAPEQIPQVVLAISALISSFRWIWPRLAQSRHALDDVAGNRLPDGDGHEG
jgi:hypothetical protein